MCGCKELRGKYSSGLVISRLMDRILNIDECKSVLNSASRGQDVTQKGYWKHSVSSSQHGNV